MKYMVAIALIRSIVEGLKQVFPGLDERVLKGAVGVLAVGTVLAYGLNVAAEVGIGSRFLIVDYAVSAVALWFATLIGHDIFGFLATSYRTSRARFLGK